MLTSITPAEVDQFILSRAEKVANGQLSPYTVRAEIQSLKKMENLVNKHYGKVDWQISSDRKERQEKWDIPLRRRDSVRSQHGPAYSPADADRLTAALAAKHGQKVRDAIIFLRATGARSQTVTDRMGNAIRPARIDLARGTVTLLEKGGKTRTVRYDREYHGELKRIVNSYGKNGPDHPIFGLDQRRLNDWVRKAAGRLGIENRGLHGFRKEFAVKRLAEYRDKISQSLTLRDKQKMPEADVVSNAKFFDMCNSHSRIENGHAGQKEIEKFERSLDTAARLLLTRDLGHNRVEVTYRYC
ncbi:MAG: hypothetical protein PHC60_04035 [Heliobacteriaceae bacterium]|nr:hypothetical protein [Heliobacteriaceae bacterium]